MSRKARRDIWFHLFHVDKDFYLETLDKSERKYWSIYLQICWINIRWRNRIYAQRNLPIYFYVHGEKNSLDQKIYFPVSHQGDFMKKKTKKTQLFISEDNFFSTKKHKKNALVSFFILYSRCSKVFREAVTSRFLYTHWKKHTDTKLVAKKWWKTQKNWSSSKGFKRVNFSQVTRSSS